MIPNPTEDFSFTSGDGVTAAAESGGGVPILEIKADNAGAKTVTTLLKTINFCEKVNVFVSHSGIRFVVEEGKYVQAFVAFKAELFKTFRVRQDTFGFKIPFKELMDCLKILGGDSRNPGETTDITSNGIGPGTSRTMYISYNGYGTPFCLSLEEHAMLTKIELKTEEPDDVLQFDEVAKVWDITIDAKMLHECLTDVESYNPEFVTLRVIPNKSLEFHANGTGGSMNISIPKDCTSIDKFCNIKKVHSAVYKLSIWRHSFKLIQTAEKVCLQMGQMDVLSFHLILKDSMETVASFFIMPVAEIDEEDEADVLVDL